MAKKTKWKPVWGLESQAKERYQAGYSIDLYALKCVRCGEIKYIEPCPNCDGTYYVAGFTTDGMLGLFCKKCKKGFSSWKCPKCGTENPISSETFLKNDVGCFIATAVCGSSLAQEVIILESFRDEILLKSMLGRAFITGYYRFSPFYAYLISQSESLKKVVRTIVVAPLVRLAKFLLKKN